MKMIVWIAVLSNGRTLILGDSGQSSNDTEQELIDLCETICSNYHKVNVTSIYSQEWIA